MPVIVYRSLGDGAASPPPRRFPKAPEATDEPPRKTIQQRGVELLLRRSAFLQLEWRWLPLTLLEAKPDILGRLRATPGVNIGAFTRFFYDVIVDSDEAEGGEAWRQLLREFDACQGDLERRKSLLIDIIERWSCSMPNKAMQSLVETSLQIRWSTCDPSVLRQNCMSYCACDNAAFTATVISSERSIDYFILGMAGEEHADCRPAHVSCRD